MMNNDVVRTFAIDIEKLKRISRKQGVIIALLAVGVGLLAYEIYLVEKYVRERIG